MENTTYRSLDEGMCCNHLHGERGVTQKIKRAMYDAAKQFVYIGFLLYEVKTYEYYYEGDYESVYEYAEAELGFKRSSTKNFIAIAETFGTITKGGEKQHTMSLQKQYSDYSYSQLTEMLAMTPAQREKTSPEMTIKQLRELKKQPDPVRELNKSLEQLDKIIKKDGQTSDQTKGLKSVLVNNYWEDLDTWVIKEIVRAGKIRWNPKSCYRITVELKKEN